LLITLKSLQTRLKKCESSYATKGIVADWIKAKQFANLFLIKTEKVEMSI
jgi:hypothetical protein